jgi:hypothetical protein
MNKNEIFNRFLQNSNLKERGEMLEGKVVAICINDDCADPLINIIRISILSFEHNPSVDYAVRKINQFLKKEVNAAKTIWDETDDI